MKESIPRVAVIGGGYWGKNLIRNFAELGALHTICDKDPQKQTEYASLYPGVYTTGDYNAILDNDEIKGVVIATPAVQHYNMTKLALQAGKDVLVEKPLALTVSEGEELASLAASNKRILMVGHILEYHPAVQKLHELVKSGELGKIHYIYSNRLNIGKLRTEENVLWSFAPHDISVILRLLGEMPTAVTASGGAYLNTEIADVTITNMLFERGVKSHIFVSWFHPFKEQKLVVVGSEKMAVFNDVAEDKLLLYHHKVKWVDRCPVAAKGEAEKVEVVADEPLKRECSHFLDCINHRNEPLTGSKNALNVLKILAASQQSLETSGQKVTLAPLSQEARTQELQPEVYIHPSSIVEPGATIGPGTRIWHFSHIMPGATIGQKCNIGQNAFIANNTRIGNNVKIQNNVSIYEGVILEDDVFCGPSCVFTNIKTPRSAYPRNTADDYTTTLVKIGASIGANATIVCGITIGAHALIGAGAVVTKDVPDHAIVHGTPATVQGWICKCGTMIEKNKPGHLKCTKCNTNLSITLDSRQLITR